MNKLKSPTLLLFGGISVVSLTGCEQIEQAKNTAVENAQTSAVQLLDKARQAESIDDVKQLANRAMQDAKQSAAEILGQASENLSNQPQKQNTANTSGSDPAQPL